MCGSSLAEQRKSSFPPVVAPDTRLLILGSLPGEKSLKAQRYYAHPRNRFWHLAGTVIGRDLKVLDYEARLAALLEAKIGLWDTIASAHRAGSLDTAIRGAVHNALVKLANSLPDLRAVAFNGAKAAKAGISILADSDLALVPLPSSSPANMHISLAEKERAWGTLREFIA